MAIFTLSSKKERKLIFLCQVLRLLEGDRVEESSVDPSGRIGQLGGLRVQTLAESGRSQSVRLPRENLKEIYAVSQKVLPGRMLQ